MRDLATDFDMAARGSSKVMLASAFVPARLHGLFFPSPPIHILTEYPLRPCMSQISNIQLIWTILSLTIDAALAAFTTAPQRSGTFDRWWWNGVVLLI